MAMVSLSFSSIPDLTLLSEARVHSFLASERNSIAIFSSLLCFPSSPAASAVSRLRWPIADSFGSPSVPNDPGHPPLTARSMRRSRDAGPHSFIPDHPSNSEARDTEPSESPDSYRLIVRIFTAPMRPAPLWTYSSRLGAMELVRMRRPFLRNVSTSVRTMSHIAGTSCHSSIRRGSPPFNTMRGSAETRSRLEIAPGESATLISLSAWLSAVHVFPQ